jgi:predicted PP-loop superfamily ATPase
MAGFAATIMQAELISIVDNRRFNVREYNYICPFCRRTQKETRFIDYRDIHLVTHCLRCGNMGIITKQDIKAQLEKLGEEGGNLKSIW